MPFVSTDGSTPTPLTKTFQVAPALFQTAVQQPQPTQIITAVAAPAPDTTDSAPPAPVPGSSASILLPVPIATDTGMSTLSWLALGAVALLGGAYAYKRFYKKR